jgi:Tol biopolymer transport system component/DNA-binding winged helix-turn-helix (wHTH) protein
MSSSDIRFYEFGEFRLDTRRRTLLKNGEPQHLSGRIFDLLLVLIQNEGRIVEHDELLDTVWEGMFVEQSNLKKSVSALRQVLGEQANESLYVKTVPRRGYSFVSPVRALGDDTETAIYREVEREIIVEEIVETEELDARGSVTALPAASTFPRTAVYGIAGLLVIAAVALGAWKYFSEGPTRFSVENVRITRLTTEGNSANPVVSSDGNYIIYVKSDIRGSHLQIKQLLTGTTNLLISLPKASYWASAFSPDGNFVYFFAKNWGDPEKSGLYKVSFLGGEARRISTTVGGGLVVSPDGKSLAMARDTENREPEIIAMDSDGRNEKRVAVYTEQVRIWSLSYSPDGRDLLASFRNQLSSDKVKYYLSEISLATGAERVLIPDNPTLMQAAAWAPDKQSILLTVRQPNADISQIWQYFPSGGELRRVTNDDNSYRSLKISSDGKTIFSTVETRISGIWTAGAGDLENFRLATNGVQMMDRVLWTGDGRLVYSGTENGVEALWIMAADGSGRKMLTDGKDGIWLQPTISGDGGWVVFTSARSGTSQIWKIGVDGQNLTQLTNSDSPVSIGQLLADNQTFYYQKYQRPEGWVIARRAADGTVAAVTEKEADLWAVSPDEKFLAFGADDPQTGKEAIFIKSLENGSVVKTFSASADRVIGWTRDSKAVIYDTPRNGASELMMQPVDGGEVRTVTDFRSDTIFWFDWSRDGKTIAVVRGKQPTDVVMIKEETK